MRNLRLTNCRFFRSSFHCCLNTLWLTGRQPCLSLCLCGQWGRISKFSGSLSFNVKHFSNTCKILLNKEQDGRDNTVSNLQQFSAGNSGSAYGIVTDKDDIFLRGEVGNSKTSWDEKLNVHQYEHKSFSPQVLPNNFDISTAKCHGCGVIFQSIDPEKPGYIIKEKNPENNKENGGPPICQRCFYIKHYNKTAPVIISQDDVIRYLSHIRRHKALILYLVDVMDVPSSLFPQLLRTVGETKRILIIGNKVDILPIDGRVGWQEQRLKEAILSYCEKHGMKIANVKEVSLISARTGFGVAQLLGQIRKYWERNGDIYLVGCSNTGKSTLFNLLLDLLNAHKGGNMLQRATVSLSPGTTLSLLRFPVGHWMLHKLAQRLHSGVEKHKDKSVRLIGMDQEIMPQQLTDYRNIWASEERNISESVVVQHDDSLTSKSGIDTLKPELVQDEEEGRTQSWFYDTPGVISKDQVTQFLTMEELKLLHPQMWIVPRTYILKPGQVILLGGLARLDYVEVKRRSKFDNNELEQVAKANQSIYFTVFASPNLPVHVSSLARADEVYEKHVGSTDLLKIPRGGEERMANFPKLESRDFSLAGIGWKESAADVVLSNIGWVALTAGTGCEVSLKAYTPNAIGLHLREPALLPTSVRQRGKRGARYQGHPNHCAYEGTRRSSPQFVKYLEHGNKGTYQWVAEAKRKRKEQQNLLKEAKIKKIVEKSLGCSAVANPPLIEGAVAYPNVRKLKEPQKKLE